MHINSKWFVNSISFFFFALASYVSTASIVVCNLLGVNRLPATWGLLGVARGVVSVIGPCFAGL